MAEKVCLREKLGDIMCEFGSDSRVFVLDTDLAKSTTANKFHDKFPKQFVEMGIAEQSAMGVASGLAAEGMIPFYISFALFTTGTPWTQLRQACYANLNVKVIGTHPGLDDGPDGASHHANEDIALTRVLPRMRVLTPSSVDELRDCIRLAIETPGPFYIRVSRDEVPVLDVPHTPVSLGKAITKYDDGSDLAILYEGSASMAAFNGYQLLKEQGVKAKLINISSVKPLDVDTLNGLFHSVKAIVTVENHSVLGGLYGAVAEVLARSGLSAKIAPVGIEDVFTESGGLAALKKKYGICGEHVAQVALELLK